MKQGLSLKLAMGNIRKNYRFFVPRILAETGLLACFYIIFTLAVDGRLSKIKGGDYIPTFMWMGTVIIGILSLIILLYTNSFLMKQRKREFGLYSVLGLEKKHICRVLLSESLIASVISVLAGLLTGVLFYKLSSIAICRLLNADIVAGFYYISPRTVLPAGAAFILIDALAFLLNCVNIRSMKPVELLKSASVGEREPKVKWPLTVLGVLTLGAGYAISITTKSPLEAILLFFAAVLLVIAGTYLLFTSGSIFTLKALKRNEGYYYRPGHMTAVSGLLYRMKQNAVGLASVAILSTGVLVMISSTFCLYVRAENTLEANFPQDCYLSASFIDGEGVNVPLPEDFISDTVHKSAENHGLKIEELFFQQYFEAAFGLREGELYTDVEQRDSLTGLCNVLFITGDTYERLTGKPLDLAGNEVAVASFNVNSVFGEERFTLLGEEYSVAESLTTFPIRSNLISVNCYGMVVSDQSVFDRIFAGQKEAYGKAASPLTDRCCVTFQNRDRVLREGDAFAEETERETVDYIRSLGYHSFSMQSAESVWEARESIYGMYGTLLFLGVLLGIVCLFATVLIIYYKQISEGYEDRNRYQIMRKIGMTDGEVRKTVRSQIMLQFFLPLVTAGIHTAFAFPILTRLMEVLLLDSRWFFAGWCAVTYVLFALVYTLIYKLTAKTYYKIVD